MPATLQSQELLSDVREFLNQDVHEARVGGKRVGASNGETFDVVDPGTGEKIASVAALQADDVNRAVDTAAEAFRNSGWARMTPNERGAILHRLADAVEARKSVFAQLEAMDCGKIFAQAESDIQNLIDTFRYFTDLAQHVNYRSVLAVKGHEAWVARHPWGPCGFIIPWNFPFLLAGWGLAPALAAGNTTVLKPAEDTPLSALLLADVAQDVGVPDGVINIVPGIGETAGAALAANPKLKRMSFTGSPEVGRMVAEVCGRNLVPVKCELGGKGAAVVFDDVDISETAERLVQAITFHTGQVCCDATRWLIDKRIYDEFVDECAVKMKAVNIGHQMDDSTQMGPVVNATQRNRVLGYLEKGVAGGAELVLEGGQESVEGCENGYYVKPALLAGSLDNVAAKEEIFGPVAYLAPFETEEQAVALANDTDYGLGNSVWSKDLARCARVAEGFESGNGWINAHNVVVHGVPYAGIGKSGMGGGVVSPDTLNDYLRPISVVRPL